MWWTKDLVQSPVPEHSHLFLDHLSWWFRKRKLWKYTNTQKLLQEDMTPNEPQLVWVAGPLVEATEKGTLGGPFEEQHAALPFITFVCVWRDPETSWGKSHNFGKENKQQFPE